MRTGLKHLLGLSATLLLLLTVILWVDSPERSTWGEVRCGNIVIGARSHMHGVGASFVFTDESHALKFTGNRFDPRPWEWSSYAELFQVADHGFAAEFMHFQQFDPTGHSTSLSVPHWFLAVVFAIPSLLYLRFLYRRRRDRTPPTPEGSAI